MVAAFGIILTIKAAVGVSSFNSMNVAISELTKTEVGTITTFVNLLFLIACFFIEKNKKIPEYLFMIVSLVCFGSVKIYFYTIFCLKFRLEVIFFQLSCSLLGQLLLVMERVVLYIMGYLNFQLKNVVFY